MKSFIATYIAKPFKSLPIAGRFRFWCLYWAYKLTGWHIRHEEWDFVLGYLPKLGDWQRVGILDVGCSRNLFCYEIIGRGYSLSGIDLEKPAFKYPGQFIRGDIKYLADGLIKEDFVICISVLEHIENDQGLALAMMIENLKIGGRLLLTIPTNEFAQGHPWRGFSYQKIETMLPENAKIREYTERAGQLCLAIERTS